MNVILGTRSTIDYANNTTTWAWAEAVKQYDRHGELPLIALLSKAKVKAISSTTRKWRDKDYDGRRLMTAALRAAGVAGATESITLAGNGFFAVATTILLCPQTGERVRVATDPTSATSVSVVRGWGQTIGDACAAIPSGSELILLGTASEEGSGIPTAVNTNPFELENYTQIFKTPYGITGTDAAVEHLTGDPWPEQVKDGGIAHMKDIELAAWFGIRHKALGAGNKEIRSMGGVDYFIRTNRSTTLGGAGTLTDLEDFTSEVAMYGNRDIFTVCGDQFVTRVNELIRNEVGYQTMAPLKVFGQDVNTVIMPNGVTLRLMTHPLFNGIDYYRNAAYMLSPEDLERNPVQGRDTHVQPDTTANGTDAKSESLLTEMTLTVRQEKNFGFIRDL